MTMTSKLERFAASVPNLTRLAANLNAARDRLAELLKAQSSEQATLGRFLTARGLAAARNTAPEQITKKQAHAIARGTRRKSQGRPAVSITSAVNAIANFWSLTARTTRARKETRSIKIAMFFYAQQFHARTSPARPDGWRPRFTNPQKDRHLVRDGHARRSQLRLERAQDVVAPFENSFANGTASVQWTKNLAECTVEINSSLNWDGYSKSTKYPMTQWTVSITAQYLPRQRLPNGDRILHGLITLGAVPIDGSELGADEAWRVVWARKRRGVHWQVEHRHIARIGAEFAHGHNLTRAIATLRTRITRTSNGSERKTARAARLHAIEQRIIEHGLSDDEQDVRISIRHAHQAGLCTPGILAWAAHHFPHLNPYRDSITARETLATGEELALVHSVIAVRLNSLQRRH